MFTHYSLSIRRLLKYVLHNITCVCCKNEKTCSFGPCYKCNEFSIHTTKYILYPCTVVKFCVLLVCVALPPARRECWLHQGESSESTVFSLRTPFPWHFQQNHSQVLCFYRNRMCNNVRSKIWTCVYIYFVMCRVTSVNRVLSSQGGDAASSELCVIQLILHLNLNAARLQQILQGTIYMYSI